MTNFVLAKEAIKDLDDIWLYIAQDNPKAAEKVENEIIDTFHSLSDNPNIGHLREDLTSLPVRFFQIYSYMVIYKADTKPLQIVRVLNASRDIPNII